MQPVFGAKFRVPVGESLVRHRVVEALVPGAGHRLVLLVAPAGAGKTTALAHFAHAARASVAWYRAEGSEQEPGALLNHLAHAIGGVVPGLRGTWSDVETAARRLDSVATPPPCVVIIDDLHELRHSPAEAALERLLHYAPPWLTFVAASRHEPAFNLARLRVERVVAEVPADVLRWRPWEAERLFRDFYRQPLRPEEAARLTHRIEGWAAGLQLFHLATHELPIGDRRQLIDDLHTRPGLVRAYLSQNVLARLPVELRTFLIDTCVLGRLLPALCDELRGRRDSAELLADLVSRRLFTVPCEDGRGYRYHEVLRSYLETTLLYRDGASQATERFARAGTLLESADAVLDAVHAYARAEQWDAVERLLGDNGPVLADGHPAAGYHRLPQSLLSADPWLQLARARTLWRDGQLDASADAYRIAEAAFGDAAGAALCQDERAELQPWIDPQQRPARTPAGLLRMATLGSPRVVINQVGTHPTGLLVAALAALLAGDLREAGRLARSVSTNLGADVMAITGSRVIEHLVSARSDSWDGSFLYAAADTVERLGWTWLARLTRLVADLAEDHGDDEVRALCATGELYGDRWGPPLLLLLGGVAAEFCGGDGRSWLAEAATRFDQLRAPTMRVWAEAWAALAGSRDPTPDARSAAERARSHARRLAVPGAVVVAELAYARATADDDGERAARQEATSLGLALPSAPTAAPRLRIDTRHADPSATAVRVTCFGGLELERADRRLQIETLKPQARTLLGRLSCPPDTPVSRERLVDDLWPTTSPERVLPTLHVTISTLRRFLEPDAARGEWSLIRRTGEAYLLHLPRGSHSDIAAFGAAIDQARYARRDGDHDGTRAALQTAFDVYHGDLMPELGNSEWLAGTRAHYQSQFAHVAQNLAEHYLADGDFDACITVAEAGLRADRYRTRLWQALAQAHRHNGDPAAAAHVDAQYATVLDELDLPIPTR
jgi:DNA-binding SARP family transcriptional activator